MIRQEPETERPDAHEPEDNEHTNLADEVRELRALVEQQQEQMAVQRELIVALQAQVASVTYQGSAPAASVARTPRRVPRRPGGSSRRALLKGAGAAAAAATVALVASEGQGAALAARATDGQPLVVGQDNSTSGTTNLTASSESSPSTVFQVDASNSSDDSGPIAISGMASPSGANSASAVGVFGASTEGTAVYGSGFGGIGVKGSSFGSYGVYGTSNDDTGVAGSSAMWVDIYAVGSGRIAQTLQSSPGAPTDTGIPYVSGEMIRDSQAELWLCVASGQPGTWVKVAHLAPGFSSGGAISYLSKPIRLLDSRGSDPNALHNGGGKISAGPPYTLQIANVNWQSVQVPATAVGAIGKLTVISYASGSGFVSLVPSGSGSPTTGTLPYGASQTLATAFNVGLGGSPGSIDIYVGGTSVDVVIDLFAVVA